MFSFFDKKSTFKPRKQKNLKTATLRQKANIHIEEAYKLIPKQGVYLVKSHIMGVVAYGMMNIGINPTVSQGNSTNIEVHFFDFKQDLYGIFLKIELLEHLRSEIKFPNIEALKTQLEKDKVEAKRCIDFLLKM